MSGIGTIESVVTRSRQAEHWSPRPGGSCESGQLRGQLFPGSDVELREHFAEVPLDGMRAQEQLGSDLRVRQPITSESSDQLLLSSELDASPGCVCGPSPPWPPAHDEPARRTPRPRID